MHSPTPAATRAVLVGVVLPDVADDAAQASLDELARLAETLGLQVVARLLQRRTHLRGGTVLGTGKLRELGRLTGGSGVVPAGASQRQTGALPKAPDDEELPTEEEVAADEFDDDTQRAADEDDSAVHAGVVIFDQELTPSQLHNLEGATSAEVLDRSALILRIFARHARSREARLQVEIAQLKYLVPRLRVSSRGRDRQRGGIGGKGAGESALELDRRRVRDRIAELEQELQVVATEANLRRGRRAEHQTVALVGYTNAGKSSLMRRLTASDVLVKDQLFATLDTTVRHLQPATRPPILISDTVGFIKKLPHDLVASFRSTLEEAKEATLLLHVIDAADPMWQQQRDVTLSVLAELGADNRPLLTVFNKIDLLAPAAVDELTARHSAAVAISALRPDDISALHARIVAFFERDMIEAELFVPYRLQRIVHVIHTTCRVLTQRHDDLGSTITVRAAAETVETLQRQLAEAD
ncbi:MAG: GTPase HflX [Deltaproteobacteria bacterium]|nr:GTPase HflX [Deltaproteobacteria bacterium]